MRGWRLFGDPAVRIFIGGWVAGLEMGGKRGDIHYR
jgi:hypothetical protein